MNMKWLYNKRHEGELCDSIINCTGSSMNTRFVVVIRLYRLILYFRLRSKDFNGPKIVFHVDWTRPLYGVFSELFDCRVIKVGTVQISMELLEDFVIDLQNQNKENTND